MINGELIVDNFAGGGGASTGIEMATGYSVDIAINHDPEAIRMHQTNHPLTKHYCESVWDVDPVEVCKGHPVALAWFSPDCKHFSKAKGGKPKDKSIRGLAWVTLRWAAKVRPRVVMLENVEEFKTWGPLNRSHRPIKAKQGHTYRKFISQLHDLGYEVQTRELVAADSEKVKAGLLKPYVGAYTQIDFSLPCPSIFDTAEEIREKYGIRAVRPLAPKTMERIARGLKKFVINSPEPFIVPIGYGERTGQQPRIHDIKEPLPTVVSSGKHYLCEPYMVQIGQTGFTADRSRDIRDPLSTVVSKNEHCLISPTLIQYHSETTKRETRGQQVTEPIMTVDGSNRYGLVAAFIQKYYAGETRSDASDVTKPLHTITARNGQSLCAATLIQMNNHCDGRDIKEPIPTITSGDGHFGEVRAFLIKYYGQGTGQDIKDPLDTVTAQDRFGLVTVGGVDYQIIDIGLRMLEPKELYGCQGFPDDYIIDHDYAGNSYPRSEQVKRCGNAVCPPIPVALVRANLPELCVAQRTPNMRIAPGENGQMKFA